MFNRREETKNTKRFIYFVFAAFAPISIFFLLLPANQLKGAFTATYWTGVWAVLD